MLETRDSALLRYGESVLLAKQIEKCETVGIAHS